MNKFLLTALIASFIPFGTAHADMEAMSQKSRTCAKLIEVEAMKQHDFNTCVKAEQDQEFHRRACNARPDKPYCRVVFKNHKEMPAVTF